VMSRKVKIHREFFLLGTILGTFLCLLVIFLGAIFAVRHGGYVAAEIVAGDSAALLARVESLLPLSLFGSVIFVGTWLCYRRYHKLTFPVARDTKECSGS